MVRTMICEHFLMSEKMEEVRNLQERMALAILETKGTEHVGFW